MNFHIASETAKKNQPLTAMQVHLTVKLNVLKFKACSVPSACSFHKPIQTIYVHRQQRQNKHTGTVKTNANCDESCWFEQRQNGVSAAKVAIDKKTAPPVN